MTPKHMPRADIDPSLRVEWFLLMRSAGLAAILALVFSPLAACGGAGADAEEPEDSEETSGGEDDDLDEDSDRDEEDSDEDEDEDESGEDDDLDEDSDRDEEDSDEDEDGSADGSDSDVDPRVAWRQSVGRGRSVFRQACDTCHPNGEDDLGPTLRRIRWTTRAMRRQIRQGSGRMRPIPESQLPDRYMDDLMAYLSTMGAVVGVERPR